MWVKSLGSAAAANQYFRIFLSHLSAREELCFQSAVPSPTRIRDFCPIQMKLYFSLINGTDFFGFFVIAAASLFGQIYGAIFE
jgi:hypothetical protein